MGRRPRKRLPAEWLSVPEVADVLGTGTSTVYTLVYDARLDAVRLGERKAWRISRASLAEFLKANAVKTTQEVTHERA